MTPSTDRRSFETMGITRNSIAVLIVLAILLAIGVAHAHNDGQRANYGPSLTIPVDDYNGPPVR